MIIQRGTTVQEQRLGGLDIIGQVNGNYNELCELLEHLGYEKINNVYTHPLGRTVIFTGNFVSRYFSATKELNVLSLIKKMQCSGNARCLIGLNEFIVYYKSVLKLSDDLLDSQYIDWLETLRNTIDLPLVTVTSSINFMNGVSDVQRNKPLFVGTGNGVCLSDKIFTFSDGVLACYRFDNEQTLKDNKIYM